MNEEPTILDYVKSVLRGKPLPIPEPEKPPEALHAGGGVGEERAAAPPEAEAAAPPADGPTEFAFPWHALIALGLALLAQVSLEPRPNRGWAIGAILYFLAAAWVAWASHREEWALGTDGSRRGNAAGDGGSSRGKDGGLSMGEGGDVSRGKDGGSSVGEDGDVSVGEGAAAAPALKESGNFRVRAGAVFAALVLTPLAFWLLGGNRFTAGNLILWLLAIASVVWAFWLGEPPLRSWGEKLRSLLHLPWKFSVSSFTVLVLIAVGLAVFFRTYQLVQTPPEMVSDQAEKLLDVWDVLHGQASIFFPRNTGREAFQMYLTAAVVKLFRTDYTFLSLKIGTVLCGLLTLPFIYGLGKELSGKRAGLFALALAGMAYWPNVISRVGLRFTLYAFFTAPVLYYLVRGLKARSRNDLLLAGLWLGAGLHGYSPFRIVPLVVVVAFALYLLHRQSQGSRRQAIWWLSMLALAAMLVFLPLMRYMLEDPSMFSYRALTRLGTLEQPLPGPAWLIFLKNLWNALVMFAWDNGEVWVVSVTHRPALDLVSGALFHLGVVLVFVRYLRQRHWQDLFILLSIPLLLLPSILSLAFPAENPILNRTSGALVPAFVIVGLALDGLLNGLEKAATGRPALNWGRTLGWGLAVVLIGWSAVLNYDLVFNQYQRAYELSAWNTSEMGQVVRDFGEMTGSTDSAWVVAFPYWVDTRLVGMSAGLPTRDLAIWPDAFSTTLADPRAKLFLIKTEDSASVSLLQQMYPQGSITLYDSRVDKDFFLFFVPPAATVPIESLPPPSGQP